MSGPSPALARRLGLGDAVLIGLGSMVGAGVFAVFGPAAGAAGSGLLLGLVIAAVVAFANAVASAPWWGFAAGWSFVIGKTASCAAMALTFATYAVPGSEWGQRAVAVVAVVTLAALNYRGITRTALLTRILVAAVLIVLTVTVVALLISDVADVGRIGGSAGLLDAGPYGILQAGGLLFFAFAGYARIATLGEEVRDPSRTIPRAITIALGLTVALYAALAVTLLVTAGPQRLAATLTPLPAAAEAAGLGVLDPMIRVGAALAALGALLALIAGIGRTSLAMARHRDLPVWLAAVHPLHRVPHRAEVAVAVVISLLVLTTGLREAIAFSSFGVLLYYAIANASAFTQPRSQRRWPRALNVLGGCACVVLAATLPWTSAVTGAGVLAAGLIGRAVVLGLRR